MFLLDERKSQRGLPCMVRHGVSNQRNSKLLRDLLHDGRLSDAGRTQKKNGALSHHGHPIIPKFILFQI